MNIVVVAPGHAFSTLDVYTGLCAGLRANGAQVHPYPLHTTLETMELLVGAARQLEIAPPGGYPDPVLIASAGIPGYAMAKRADWVIFVHGMNVPPSIAAALRRGSYRTAVLLTESPYQLVDEAPLAAAHDVAFTTERNAVSLLPGNVHYLPHAWNPAVHTPEGPKAAPCDVFFCGTRYPERDALLAGVDWTGIDLRDRSVHYTGQAALDDLEKQVLGNVEVAMHYRAAKVSLNAHRTIQDPVSGGTIAIGAAASLNPRAYEIPACGGFMVSDARAELSDIFGDSVPVYSDSASLEGMLRYFLSHEEERSVLAARQFAAVQGHSWTARAMQLLDILAASAAPRVA